MSQSVSERGNTRNRARSWFLTYNNCDVSFVSLVSLFTGTGGGIIKFVGQRERGESGTEHFQGVIQFKHQVDFNILKALDPAIHWEKCRALSQALAYCTKAETRIDGPWAVGWEIPESIRTLDTGSLRPWQHQLLEYIDEGQGDRSILWLWECAGNVGKTAMAKLLAVKRGALVLGGKGADIRYGVSQWIRQRPLRIAIFHFTRTNEQFISYEAIEAVKDGIFFSSKYESGMVVFNPPIIICFANYRPEEAKLSADRWDIRYIMEDGLMKDGENIHLIN